MQHTPATRGHFIPLLRFSMIIRLHLNLSCALQTSSLTDLKKKKNTQQNQRCHIMPLSIVFTYSTLLPLTFIDYVNAFASV